MLEFGHTFKVAFSDTKCAKLMVNCSMGKLGNAMLEKIYYCKHLLQSTTISRGMIVDAKVSDLMSVKTKNLRRCSSEL